MKGKILIADDDRNLTEIISSVLRGKGYITEVAYDGTTALLLIKQFKPDLLILDIMMPIMDGYKVCQTLSEDYTYAPLPKVIILTARNSPLDKKISAVFGVAEFMNKPFDIDSLISKVDNLLGCQK